MAAVSGVGGTGGAVASTPLDLQTSDQIVLAVAVIAVIGYALFLLIRARADRHAPMPITEALA